MASRAREQTTRIAGRTLRVSNLDKVLYPATGTTKGEVIDYYLKVADTLIQYAAWRPATRKRWVDGVGTADAPAHPFFRKNLEDSAPDWIPTAKIRHSEHENAYPLVNEPAVLAWLGQVAALEIHVPQWCFGTSLEPQNPDRMVLDLDPGPGLGLADCARVAVLCRQILDGMGLQAYPVTSGSKGIHLYAGLDGSSTSEQISAVARELATALEQDHPDLVVSKMKKSLRAGKVLIDWSQNNASKTTICPYSLRGREHPMVAAPRTWEEIEDPELRHLDFREVLQRLEEGIDPLAPLASAQPASDPLSTYRSMRDATRTPEPVPAEPPAGGNRSDAPGDASFVIQKHQARRLHWDFRLEHHGVLMSWAVPKGPPLEQGTHRLAVMTEDHPMEYAKFSGTIPKGEYGAGVVEIWDSGTCTIEEWHEDKVVAVLCGSSDGGLGATARRYVLVHAPKMGNERNWLLQLTKEQPEQDTEQDVPQPPGEEAAAGPNRPEPAPAHAADDSPPAPMLATAGTAADIDDETCWSFEMKWDGYRAICQVTDQGTRLYSRNGKDLSASFPELAELDQLAPAGAVLDGEIVALNGQGRPDFGLLQQRLGHRKHSRPTGGPLPAVHLMLFDALALPAKDGAAVQDLTALGYTERRQRLATLVSEGEHIHIPPEHPGALAQALATSDDLGLEGVMAKECDSPYEPGVRSETWIKLKHQRHQEVVVIGWREGHGSRERSFGSLLVAVPDPHGVLKYAGRVGSGFTDDQLGSIHQSLQRMQRKTPPVADVPAADRRDAHWVSPREVGEVRYSERTRDGRLRHPVWRGWRPDKQPGEVRWE